ncbi:hypothetical protein DWY22_03820 [Heyndrickxia coagulans]|nr:hypothetical protein DWY22_03820 [Heyndrickxia coagulans]RGR99621.1 hypothetical protein DWY16_03975 [Heyndrickxia coagulans]
MHHLLPFVFICCSAFKSAKLSSIFCSIVVKRLRMPGKPAKPTSGFARQALKSAQRQVRPEKRRAPAGN